MEMLQLLGCWRGGEGLYCNLVETEADWDPGECDGKTQRRLEMQVGSLHT